MIKEKSTSILDASEIMIAIDNKYKPTHHYVSCHRDEVSIRIEVTSNKKGFEVTTPIVFEDNDILDIAKKVLKNKEIKTSQLRTVVQVEPGDSGEPMDYGTSVFKGVEFTWDEDND